MLTAPRSTLFVLLGLLLSGCGTDSLRDQVPPPESPYCLRGGSDDAYSCDPAKQEPIDIEAREAQLADAELDAKLAEIKNWLRTEKAALADSPGIGDESDVHLPPPKPAPRPATAPPAPPLPDLLPDARYREALQDAARLQRQGYNEHARLTLEQLTLEFPERPEAFNNLGVLLVENGQYSEAIARLRQALETHPHYASIHDNLSKLYAALAGNTYTDALGMRRVRVPPQLDTLTAAEDANDDDSIATRVGTRIEYWADSPGFTPEQQAALYIPGYRPDTDTSHRQWLESLTGDDRPFHLQEYELAVMSPDWIEARVTVTRTGNDAPEQRVLTLVRSSGQWLISSERDK